MDRRRLRHVALACGAVFFLCVALLFYGVPNVGARLWGSDDEDLRLHDAKPPNEDKTSAPELSQADFFDWHTRSQFRPVNQPIENKSVQDLCNAFPKHLLRDIQPVLKTGHALLETRVKLHLQIIDVVSDLRAEFVHDNDQLRDYLTQQELAANGTLLFGEAAQVKGWQVDKFKFLPQVSRAWRMRPEKRWYVFYEDDTYIVWDKMFRLLTNFDPDMPWYFGSASPGARDTWMANGGPGYVLSREAVRRLVKDDFDTNGAFVGSKLSQRWENQMMRDCCDDSILGLALHEDAQTDLSGLFPMFQPHPLHGIPFSDLYWCQPVIGMHKTSAEDMAGLRKWEESRRITRRPLLFADLVDYLNLTTVASREDWLNSDWQGYPAFDDSAHASFDACGDACKADANCFQWTYHLRTCNLGLSIRLGQAKVAGIEDWRSDEEKTAEWDVEDRRYLAGWDLDGIRKWMSAEGRDC